MKTAIVTGAGRGIGFLVAKTLLEKKFNVVLCARHESDEIASLKEIYKDHAIFVRADISNKEDRDLIISTTTKNYGTPFLLVNNAGVAPKVRKDMLEIEEKDFDYVVNINLKGTYFLTQSVANLMKKENKGYIVNIGSISADTVSLNRAEYCMSKAGIRMATELFAERLAGDNIFVFEIAPGVIDTPMISKVKEKYDNLAENGTIPAKRLGTGLDVAKVISTIVDGNLDYCTGTVLHCGGGLHIKTL